MASSTQKAKSWNTFKVVADVTVLLFWGVGCLARVIFDQLLNYESSAYADSSLVIEEVLAAIG
jgi:hypothetical protein